MTALLLAVVLTGAVSGQAAQEPWGDSLKALRATFGKEITTRLQPSAEIRYCPDNTCDAFTGGRGAKKRDVADFALLYVWGVSTYIYLEEWREGPVPSAVETAIKRQVPCSEQTDHARLTCALRKLAKTARIQLSFVRFDEGFEAIVKINLEDELGSPR